MGKLYPQYGERAWVFGVLNVTPDSFSDGGRWSDTEAAVERGRTLARLGADIVDVGGESTRPGAHRVDAATEAARVVPVVEALHADGIACSIDTTRATVAAAAVEAGAVLVNDVSGGQADPGMASVVAGAGVPWILMHWRGHSDRMQQHAHYQDVVADVVRELSVQVDKALAGGAEAASLILDPGLGFAKNADHNWALLSHLDQLTDLGFPVLVGASRKRFLGELLAAPDGELRPPPEREAATAAVSLLAAQQGVWGIRVHEPQPTRDALRVLDRYAGEPGRDGAASGGPLGRSPRVAASSVRPAGGRSDG